MIFKIAIVSRISSMSSWHSFSSFFDGMNKDACSRWLDSFVGDRMRVWVGQCRWASRSFFTIELVHKLSFPILDYIHITCLIPTLWLKFKFPFYPSVFPSHHTTPHHATFKTTISILYLAISHPILFCPIETMLNRHKSSHTKQTSK